MPHSVNTSATILRAFSDTPTGGNPAGVVLNADHLSPSSRQEIAASLELSETAFVSSAQGPNAFRIEFFTPNRQIPLCGHATIATCVLMASRGLLPPKKFTFETMVEPLELEVRSSVAYMTQRPLITEVLAPENRTAVAQSLQLSSEIFVNAPVIASTGGRFLMVEVSTKSALAAISPDQERILEISKALDLVGYYVYSREANSPEHAAIARMFAPAYGIAEESATGMAAGALGALLCQSEATQFPASLVIEQGQLMEAPSPSLISVKLDSKTGAPVIGGTAVVVEERQL